MRMRVLLASLVSLLCVTSTWAQSVLIDNFDAGPFNLTAGPLPLPPSDFLLSTLLGANTIGGQRIARAHWVSGGGAGDSVNVNNTAQPGRFETSLTANPTGHFHLYYGYDVFNTSFPDPVDINHVFHDLNANVAATLGANPSVSMDFTTLDHPATFVLKIVTNHGGGANQAVTIVTQAVAANLSPFTLTFNNADIVAGLQPGSGPLNFSDVDQVILETQDLPGGTDMVMDNLRFSVPEPATYALIAGSMFVVAGGVWMRRRVAQQDKPLPEEPELDGAELE